MYLTMSNPVSSHLLQVRTQSDRFGCARGGECWIWRRGIVAAGQHSGDSSVRPMANRLDVVSVGIEHEGTVIGGMVVRSDAGCPVIGAAGSEGRRMESIDGRAAIGHEGDMDWRSGGSCRREPKRGLAVPFEAGAPVASGLLLADFHHDRDSERRQCPLIKAQGAAIIAYAEPDMIDDVHRPSARPIADRLLARRAPRPQSPGFEDRSREMTGPFGRQRLRRPAALSARSRTPARSGDRLPATARRWRT